MKTETEAASGGLLSRIASGMTSLAGITTAVATIMTSVTAGLGVVVHHQTSQLQQAHHQLGQQARQIRVLRSASVSAQAATPGSTVTGSPDTGQTLDNVAHYLTGLTPTVDHQDVQNGQQVIAARPYPNSISFRCDGSYGGQPDEAYDVAGSTEFSAEVGIADNMENVTGVIATVTFSNEAGQQLGKPVQVSLGHPVKVRLNISGLTQLGMTCNGRDAHTSQAVFSFSVSLGDAGIT